tara:strand:- start:24 stop:551 length:528 start_codon:yes stop_codon:yes gene_type:complete
MDKKTTTSEKPSFYQSIDISNKWCMDWEEELLSDEVLADRVAELVKTKNGLRGFFAYALSDINCSLLDKLPSPLIFKFAECGEQIVEITLKNLIMSSAQIINHQRDNNPDYEEISSNISDRCINLLKLLDTKLVSNKVSMILDNLDNLGNSINNSKNYDLEQKEFIREKISKIAK